MGLSGPTLPFMARAPCVPSIQWLQASCPGFGGEGPVRPEECRRPSQECWHLRNDEMTEIAGG